MSETGEVRPQNEAFLVHDASPASRGHTPRYNEPGEARKCGDLGKHTPAAPASAAPPCFPRRRPAQDVVVNYHRMRRSFEQRARDLLPCGGEHCVEGLLAERATLSASTRGGRLGPLHPDAIDDGRRIGFHYHAVGGHRAGRRGVRWWRAASTERCRRHGSEERQQGRAGRERRVCCGSCCHTRPGKFYSCSR